MSGRFAGKVAGFDESRLDLRRSLVVDAAGAEGLPDLHRRVLGSGGPRSRNPGCTVLPRGGGEGRPRRPEGEHWKDQQSYEMDEFRHPKRVYRKFTGAQHNTLVLDDEPEARLSSLRSYRPDLSLPD